MNPMFKSLDTETQLLVSVGAAVAAGCIPCLENIVTMAQAESVDPKKLKAAAIIGQFIKDQPASHMKTAADRLLGTHLQARAVAISCPAETGEEPLNVSSKSQAGCGCR